jgi:hypothetical protein
VSGDETHRLEVLNARLEAFLSQRVLAVAPQARGAQDRQAGVGVWPWIGKNIWPILLRRPIASMTYGMLALGLHYFRRNAG